METHRRLILWLMMFLLTVMLFIKGRVTSEEEVSAAFVHFGPTQTTVRFEGNVVNPGIYEYPGNPDLRTVMKMTVPEWRPARADNKLLSRMMRSGDVVELAGENRQHIDITIKRMPAREMVVLGIPLDPNRMEIDDWESLPGIGPALALRIVKDRQKYGDFASLADLERVSGIGKGKINQLAKYF
jgi:competence protein ComEA